VWESKELEWVIAKENREEAGNFRGLEGESEGWRELKKIPLEGALDNKHQALNCYRSKEKSGKGSCYCLLFIFLLFWNDSAAWPLHAYHFRENSVKFWTLPRNRLATKNAPPGDTSISDPFSGLCDEPPGGNSESPDNVHWSCLILLRFDIFGM